METTIESSHPAEDAADVLRPALQGMGDFLGVEVNIAARVGDAAKGEPVPRLRDIRKALDPSGFRVGAEQI